MTLASKTLTELRAIAQSLDIPDVFKKEKHQLVQAIESRSVKYTETKENKPEIGYLEYSKFYVVDPDEVKRVLAKHIEKGLKFTHKDLEWHMKFGNREDSGTLVMPIKDIVACANGVLQ